MSDKPIWKKEIRFRKKTAPAAPQAQPAPVVPQGERPVSIWKRELKFRSPVGVAGESTAGLATPQAELPLEPQLVEVAPRFEPAPEWDASDPTPVFESQTAAEAPLPSPASEVQVPWRPGLLPEAQTETLRDEVSVPAAHELQTVAEPEVTPATEAPVPAEPLSQPEWAAPDERPPVDELASPVAAPFDTADELQPPPPAQTLDFEQPAEAKTPPVAEPVEVRPPLELTAAVDSSPAQPSAPAEPWTPHPATDPVVEPVSVGEPEVEAPAVVTEPVPDSNEPGAQLAPEVHIEDVVHLETPPTLAAEPDSPVAAAPEPPAVVPVAATAAVAKSGLLKREIKLSRPRRRKVSAAAAATAAVTVTPTTASFVEPGAASVQPATTTGTEKKTPAAGNAASAHKVKNVVGLRIGSSQLAAAYVQNNGTFELEQLVRSSIPRGIVSGGEVRDPEALTRELKKFFSQNKLPRRGVRLGIASNRIGVRVLEVHKVDDPKLFDNSIRFHAQEVLPIPVTDAILDWVQIGEGRSQGLESTARLLLVFAHRELVERHVDACKRAGLKLDGVDFEAFALLRALTAPLTEGDTPTQAVVAVAVGHERTIFAVSDGRTCDFTRVLEWGGGTLDVALGRALNLTPSQAEPVKLALALDGSIRPHQLSPDEAEAARAAIRTEIQTLARELVSSLQFYQSRPESLDIGSILLSGGGSELNGFAAELERAVGVPVELGDPLGRVELGRKLHRPAELGSFAVAIGLGIED